MWERHLAGLKPAQLSRRRTPNSRTFARTSSTDFPKKLATSCSDMPRRIASCKKNKSAADQLLAFHGGLRVTRSSRSAYVFICLIGRSLPDA
jgi:hypothetical protein